MGKRYFYIFDYLRNFEYFREEKNGRDGGMAHSLGERIFAHKCALIRLLQGGAWAAPEYADFRSRLVGEVNVDALMKGRPPFDRPKFFTLFGTEAQKRLFEIVRGLNANASDAA